MIGVTFANQIAIGCVCVTLRIGQIGPAVVALQVTTASAEMLRAFAIWVFGCFITSAAVAGGYPVVVTGSQDEDGSWSVVVHNQGAAPILIKVDLVDLVNGRSGVKSIAGAKALEPGAKETMAVVVPDNPTARLSFKWKSSWVFGRAAARGEHEGVYRPPFPADLTFETVNSLDSGHSRPQDAYALDIVMPQGTPIVAARSGFVMDVAGELGGDKVKDGGRPAYEEGLSDNYGGYVRIWHDDGTFAEYLYLQSGTIRVTPGDRVEAGSTIGLSGSSGGDSAPHLHFSVRRPAGGFGAPPTVPIKIEMAGRGILLAKAGTPIGASVSVNVEAEIVRRDPLVLAQVAREKVVQLLMPSGQIGPSVGGWPVAALARLAVVAVAIGAIVFCVVWLIRGKGGRWFPWRSRPKHDGRGQEEGAGNGEEKTWPLTPIGDGLPRSLRPKPGFLYAEAEQTFRASLSLAIGVGFSVHAKVSLHRLFARPAEAIDDAEAYAILRGESIDYALVREGDGRVIAAIEVDGVNELIGGQLKAREIKGKVLERAGIKTIRLSPDAGPEEIRKALNGVVRETHHSEFRTVYVLAGLREKLPPNRLLD